MLKIAHALDSSVVPMYRDSFRMTESEALRAGPELAEGVTLFATQERFLCKVGVSGREGLGYANMSVNH